MTTTAWLNIPNYPGYQASSDGRIRSVAREITDGAGRSRRLKSRELSRFEDSAGYLRVGLRAPVMVHRLVCLAFNGLPLEVGLHAAHRDGNKQNNVPSNLYWATIADNNRDISRHGHNRNANKTKCPAGHRYDDANTLVSSTQRSCRACHRDRNQTYREKRRAIA